MMKTKIRQVIAIIAVLLLAITVNNCSSDKAENNGDKSAPPAFMNGIDENTYLALWSAKTYSTTDGQLIPAGDLPYKYFASKGVNFARIRVWAGTASDGNYANALANGLAAKEAGLKTLLVIFLSEQWPDNIGCDPLKVAAIFRNLTFAEKKAAIQEYTGQLIQNFKNDGLQFDLYAVDNEVLNCVCGETDKANMADLLNTAYDAIRAVDPNAKFVFHAPHLLPAAALTFFSEMITTHNVRCDYLSTSFYPLQYGSTAFDDYKKFIDDLYAAHGKPFIISEWSYSDSPLPSNSIWITSGVMKNTPLTGYPQSSTGQADLVRDLLLWAKGSNGKVAGVFYWSPMFNLENYDQNTDTYYGWLWLSLFDINGKAKPALEALSYGLEYGPVFYVDVAGGNDANSGTAPGSPWKSLAKVSGSQFQAGSTIYLKRGSTWNEQLTIPASGITIDAYGTGPLPIIDGSRDITIWTAQGSGLYSSASITLAADEALGNLSENGGMMSFLTWTADAAATFSGAPDGTYSYDYASAELYTKPASTPSGNVYRASVKLYGITATSRSDVIVKNVEITRFSLHGVHFQDCVRCGVYDSVITKGGGATIAPNLYAGNGIEFDNSSASGVVEGVTVSDIFDSGISPQTWLSNQAMSSISIRDSQISTCGFAGIEVSVLSNGSTTNSSITGVLISGMTITAAGRGWSGRRYGTEGYGIRIKADNGAGSMSGVQLDTTSVSGSMGDGVRLAGDIGTVSLHRMNISNNSYGISLEEPSETSAKLRLTSSLVHHNVGSGIIYNSPTAAGFELFQNTFSDNAGINLAVLNWNGTATAKIQNNIFYGSSTMTHLYSGPTLTGAVIDNNCYNELANMFGYGVNAYSMVFDFRTATSFETNGIGGIVDMTNPSAGDFILLNSSACKTLGSSSVGVAVDYSGYPFSTPPSSGAYQYR